MLVGILFSILTHITTPWIVYAHCGNTLYNLKTNLISVPNLSEIYHYLSYNISLQFITKSNNFTLYRFEMVFIIFCIYFFLCKYCDKHWFYKLFTSFRILISFNTECKLYIYFCCLLKNNRDIGKKISIRIYFLFIY